MCLLHSLVDVVGLLLAPHLAVVVATYLTLIFVLYAGFSCVASKVVQTHRGSFLGVDEVWDTF